MANARAEGPERLDGAFLRGTELEARISFTDCSLLGADLTRADVEGADFVNANLRGADLTGATLFRGDFSQACFRGAKLAESHASHATFEEADLGRADLADAEFERTEFRNAELWTADFSEALVWRGDFTGANLRRAVLEDANLKEADLKGADLAGADFTRAKLEDTNFRDANARDTTFTDANLEDALFIRTELRDASLDGTHLYQTLFSDTRINDRTEFGEYCYYESSEKESGADSYEKAAWVYRCLQSLHDQNSMANSVRHFHVRKEEAQRKRHRILALSANWTSSTKYKHGCRWLISTLNHSITRHGESLARLVGWSAFVILVCGLSYPFTGGIEDGGVLYELQSPAELLTSDGLATLGRGLYFSTITFTTIGYANVAPHGDGSRLLVGLESLVGAIFIALFVYVLGRRVAR